jgi:alanyl-tRNA synthetase
MMIYQDKLYFNDTYCYECDVKCIKFDVDEQGKKYCLFESTIFHPQGGGQPTDTGFFIFNDKKIAIDMVKKIDQEIRHYIDEDIDFRDSILVHMVINKDHRMLCAKLHTAGQLLSDIVRLLPKNQLFIIKAHHFPQEACLEFEGEISNIDLFKQTVEEKINQVIQLAYPVKVYNFSIEEFEKKFPEKIYKNTDNGYVRLVKIGSFDFVPCGGTHVKNISEIGGVKIRKITSKKGITKIGYDII